MLPVLDLLFRLALSATLLAAAVPKLARPRSFFLTVVSYEVLPLGLAAPFALAAPVAEFVIAVALALGVAQRPTGIAAAFLFLSFTIAVAVNVARGRVVDCGCFGTGRRQTGPSLLAQDLVLLGIAVVIAAWGGESSASSLSALTLTGAGHGHAPVAVSVLILALVIALVLLALGERRQYWFPAGRYGGLADRTGR